MLSHSSLVLKDIQSGDIISRESFPGKEQISIIKWHRTMENSYFSQAGMRVLNSPCLSIPKVPSAIWSYI